MRLASFIRDMPARVTAGAFILNSGLSKLSADEQTAQGLHQMATGVYPFLGSMSRRTSPSCSVRVRSRSEPPCCCRWCRPEWPACS
jgi:hypothetical protein